ncbi:hypothetical protein DMN91_001608 [Ooceraea biroi]|uniref:Polyprenal reductase n=1 Tax=Ooceraea biroi TaxID=2015173 RepID=A0A026WF99_OOCBI|nr:polyprenol reductase [Ooceraea biroi]EZA54361.1 putative polyprenol reductase [Ooceraea biroi]RLU25452.1 hypothetical protein DMN91_001608 [Ooceraea biroi]
MDENIMRCIFILIAAFVGLVGLLMNCLEPYLPVWLIRTYRYGKFSATENHFIVAKFEVPKKWFKHMYLFAAPASIVTLFLVLYKYIFNGTLPEIILMALDTSLSTSRQASVPAEAVILATVLISIHCCKRLYESCYVSIFSNQKIHVSHYLLGPIHYTGVFVCIVGEAEGFVRGTHAHFSWDKLISGKLVCAFVLLLSSYMQFRTNIILRNLRKRENSDVVSYAHKVPFDGLYKYISAPLQFTEILVYLMLSVILWQASTFHYITIWVVANQVMCAVLTHQWYRATFKNYPKERKALIPYIW